MSAEPTKRCIRCGYTLEHLPELRCPECGLEFDPRWPETYFAGQYAYPGWQFLLLAVLTPLAALLFGVLTSLLGSVFPWLICAFATLALEVYVAARSGRELLKPRSLRERRICWLGALVISAGVLLLTCGWPASCMLGVTRPW